MKKRDIIEVKIDQLGFGGEASGNYEGQTVFVKNAIPGQKVKVLVKKLRKGKTYYQFYLTKRFLIQFTFLAFY